MAKFNKNWLHDHINDPYVKLAQREGYRARAAYKLKEIDEQDRLIKPNQVVIDLGAAPGSWSQYVRQRMATAPRRADGRLAGTIIAIDLLPMQPIADVSFILGDFRDEIVYKTLVARLQEQSKTAKADLVLSDMAPNLSGIASADAARMSDLADLALDFAQTYLKPDGALLIKCFHGSGYSQIVEQFKDVFRTVVARKPNASRDKSAETFLLAKCLK